MKRRESFPATPFRGFAVGFMVLSMLAGLLSLSAMGFLVYILYRVATHPW